MPEQASTATNGALNGAAGKPLWQQTQKGRAKLAAIAKRTRKDNPHSTRRVSEAKIRRLGELVAGGATVKAAAQQLGIGYSTAQRYERGLRKQAGKTPKATRAKQGFRLAPAQIRRIEKLIRANVPAAEIAKRAKCHLSSVYHYRRQFENAVAQATPDTSHEGIPAMAYVELRQANKHLWNAVWDERREPTDSELRFSMAYRRMNSVSAGDEGRLRD